MNETGIKPVVIQEICQLAQKHNINKVILFGSRARGDYKRVSDIDLAVSGGDFARFALDVDEETSTLLKYDIVDLDGSVQRELKDSIEKEGRKLASLTIYRSESDFLPLIPFKIYMILVNGDSLGFQQKLLPV